jgi:hypothetical protein
MKSTKPDIETFVTKQNNSSKYYDYRKYFQFRVLWFTDCSVLRFDERFKKTGCSSIDSYCSMLLSLDTFNIIYKHLYVQNFDDNYILLSRAL